MIQNFVLDLFDIKGAVVIAVSLLAWNSLKRKMKLGELALTLLPGFLSAWLGGRMIRLNSFGPTFEANGYDLYIALVFGLLVSGCISRLLLTTSQRCDLAQTLSYLLPLGIAALKWECFLEGCCWGMPASVPWAVQYFGAEDPTPWIGIPLHPVQLYEVTWAISVAAMAFYFAERRQQKMSLSIVLVLLAGGRLLLESYRGDHLGSDHLPIGVLITLAGAAVTGFRERISLFYKIPRAALSRGLLLVLFSAVFTGCLSLPQPPGGSIVLSKKWIAQDLALYSLKKAGKKNLVIAVLDEESDSAFRPQLKLLYLGRKNLSFEEIVWWRVSQYLGGVYDQVIRIPRTQVRFESLRVALMHMEALSKPYDAILITHGIDNHLSSTTGYPLISWREIQTLQGQLKKANIVYMQSCYGLSLKQDWLETGAKAVIGFSEKTGHDNIFYLDTFLSVQQRLASENPTLSRLHEVAQSQLKEKLREPRSGYRNLLKFLRDQGVWKGESSEYEKHIMMPDLIELSKDVEAEPPSS